MTQDRTLTLEIFIHMDAVNRNEWQAANDDRPLTELGVKQSQRIAEELRSGPVQALFSSPALRCRQSLEPISQQLNLPINIVQGFRDTQGYRAPPGWERPDRPGPDPLGGAFSAGSAYAALQDIRAKVPSGRAVLCSYGDIIPALFAFLAGAHDLKLPPRMDAKGALYTIVLGDGHVSLTGREPSAGFPS